MEPYQELEKEYAHFVGAKHGVSCNSGTAALHLALLALGVGPGDEVIVPDFTMAAVAFAVSYTGATPVFADVSLDTYGIEPREVEKLITSKTKAVIVVHTYGRLADIGKVIELCRPRGIAVIEDACEAQGAIDKSQADATCYSFYRNKIIAAEEGGMLTTDNHELALKAHYFKNMAFSPEHDYMHRHIGFNYRMPNAQAKLALVSLYKYPENSKARRRIEGWYEKCIPDHLPGRAAVWFYETPGDPDEVMQRCPRARRPFKPLSSFPMYGGGKGRPCALALSRLLVLLPVVPGMTYEEVKDICGMP